MVNLWQISEVRNRNKPNAETMGHFIGQNSKKPTFSALGGPSNVMNVFLMMSNDNNRLTIIKQIYQSQHYIVGHIKIL